MLYDNYTRPYSQQSRTAVPQFQNFGFYLVPIKSEDEVMAYPVGIGQTVFLMDFDKHTLYIKSVDQSGMPQPIRTFDERITKTTEQKETNYVSREEFDKFRSEIKEEVRRRRKPDDSVRDGRNVQS